MKGPAGGSLQSYHLPVSVFLFKFTSFLPHLSILNRVPGGRVRGRGAGLPVRATPRG